MIWFGRKKGMRNTFMRVFKCKKILDQLVSISPEKRGNEE
jgi:hypothetical protein